MLAVISYRHVIHGAVAIYQPLGGHVGRQIPHPVARRHPISVIYLPLLPLVMADQLQNATQNTPNTRFMTSHAPKMGHFYAAVAKVRDFFKYPFFDLVSD
jgi:hypothetical protein